jgi:hypothetical protein
MVDDPTECLRRAIECERLSQTAPDAVARATFAAMAKTWRQLAREVRTDRLRGRTPKDSE